MKLGKNMRIEPWLGNNPVIANISFGAERKFEYRKKETEEK